MTESRLNSLDLLNVHKDKHVDIDLIVNQFAKKKNRRIQLED